MCAGGISLGALVKARAFGMPPSFVPAQAARFHKSLARRIETRQENDLE